MSTPFSTDHSNQMPSQKLGFLAMTPRLYLLLIVYFVMLLWIAPINLLSFDTYYYWDWSRHLALSYYDGSPMIAYLIRLSTSLFGDTLFALSFLGILITFLMSAVVYKTAQFFLTREASWVAMLALLFNPLITIDLLRRTTYDTPLLLFWAFTIYYAVKFIKTSKVKALYGVGVCAGLMMLSKYTGITLIFSLFIFLIFSPYRSLFKTKHFYFAICLAIIIFSPVLIWNYQNQWQSFTYQLKIHQLNHSSHYFYHVIIALFKSFLPVLNFMLIPPFVIGHINSNEQTANIVKLCRIICITFLCFFLMAASKNKIMPYWHAPYLISSALLLGYCFDRFPHYKFIIPLIFLYGLISFFILINNTVKYNFIPSSSNKMIYYHLINQFNLAYPQLSGPVFTSGWMDARMLFFLKDKPFIYTLNCGAEQNQYAIWSTDINKKIANKTLKKVLFIDRLDRLSCLKNYFDFCEKVPTGTYSYKHKDYTLHVYRCVNLTTE